MIGELFIVRPQPGADATAVKAQKAGFATCVAPLFHVEPVNWNAKKAERYDAILFGSANALRHGGPGLKEYRELPAYAVGATTAEEASRAGFDVVKQGSGGIDDLLPDLFSAGHKHVLRLTGRDHTEAQAKGMVIETQIVYDAQAELLDSSLSSKLAAVLNDIQPDNNAVILLHSARAARHMSALVEAHGIDRTTIKLAAFGSAIAEAAGPGWADVAYAEEYRDEALLAVAEILCKKV